MRFLIVGAALSAALIGAVVYAVPGRASGLAGLHEQVVGGDSICMADEARTGQSRTWSSEGKVAAAWSS